MMERKGLLPASVRRERNLAMYHKWRRRTTLKALAEEYGMSPPGVREIVMAEWRRRQRETPLDTEP